MKVVICGSMSFTKEMLTTKDRLEKLRHVCVLPEGVELYATGDVQEKGGSEGAQRKITTI